MVATSVVVKLHRSMSARISSGVGKVYPYRGESLRVSASAARLGYHQDLSILEFPEGIKLQNDFCRQLSISADAPSGVRCRSVKLMKKTAVVIIAMVGLLSSCLGFLESPETKIIGTWEMTFIFRVVYEFKADGTMVVTSYDEASVYATSTGTWSADESTLTMTETGSTPESILYSISSDGKSMTMTPTTGGLSVTMVKQ